MLITAMPLEDNSTSITAILIPIYLFVLTTAALIAAYFASLCEYFKQNSNPHKKLIAFLRRKIQKLRSPKIVARLNSRMHSMSLKRELHQYSLSKSSFYCFTERNRHCPIPVFHPELFRGNLIGDSEQLLSILKYCDKIC